MQIWNRLSFWGLKAILTGFLLGAAGCLPLMQGLSGGADSGGDVILPLFGGGSAATDSHTHIVAGTLTDGSGQPLQNTDLRSVSGDGTVVLGRSDQNGNLQLLIQSGSARCSAGSSFRISLTVYTAGTVSIQTTAGGAEMIFIPARPGPPASVRPGARKRAAVVSAVVAAMSTLVASHSAGTIWQATERRQTRS